MPLHSGNDRRGSSGRVPVRRLRPEAGLRQHAPDKQGGVALRWPSMPASGCGSCRHRMSRSTSGAAVGTWELVGEEFDVELVEESSKPDAVFEVNVNVRGAE